MKKTITENPKTNVDVMHNMVFVKDKEVYLRGIGEDYTDISLVDFCKEEYKRLYDIEIEESDPCELGEYMDDDSLLSLFYWSCVGFAEVREYLKKYENIKENIKECEYCCGDVDGRAYLVSNGSEGFYIDGNGNLTSDDEFDFDFGDKKLDYCSICGRKL
ncbi:hypothetical protein ACYIU4_001035 [Clostridium botulinum]